MYSHHQQQHPSHPHSQHPDALLSMGLAMPSPVSLPSSTSSTSSVFHSSDVLCGAAGLTGSVLNGGGGGSGGDGSSMSSPTSMASMSSAFGLSSAIHGHPHHPHGHPAASLHGLSVPVGLSMGIHGPLSSLQAEKRKQRRIRTTFTSSQLKVIDVSVSPLSVCLQLDDGVLCPIGRHRSIGSTPNWNGPRLMLTVCLHLSAMSSSMMS